MPLTAKQNEANKILAGPQRHTALVGGSRSGKTFLLCRAVVIRALRAAKSRHAIFRLRANAAKQTIWLDTLPKVMEICFPGLKARCNFREQYGYVVLPNGSEIWVAGLDDKERVDKILGMEFATIYYNEASQIPWSSVVVSLTRLAQKCAEIKNRCYVDLNPGGTAHWSYRLFVEGKSPDTGKPRGDSEDFRIFFINPQDNAENIDAAYIASLKMLPEKQRRRFFDGKYTAEVDGALWTTDSLERTRVERSPALRRVVIAVDPSGASGEEDYRSDEIGIVAAGIGFDGHCYALADSSGRYSPEEWGRIAVQLYRDCEADKIVYEKNFGGDMVRATIHAVNRNIPTKAVSASRGKAARAEPIAALWELTRAHIVGSLPDIEDQLSNFSVSGYKGDRSPDRADALIWACSELIEGETSLVFPMNENEYLVDDFVIPEHYKRVYGLYIDASRCGAVWLAMNPEDGVFYAFSELSQDDQTPVANVYAIKTRGEWIPGVAAGGASTAEDRHRTVMAYADLRLDLWEIDDSPEAGNGQARQLAATGKLKIFKSLGKLRAEMRSYQGDPETSVLCNGLRFAVQHGPQMAKSKPKPVSNQYRPRLAQSWMR